MTEENKEGTALDAAMPKIRELTIGIREPKKIRLYPLAVRPEMQVLRKIGDAWGKISSIEVPAAQDGNGEEGKAQQIANAPAGFIAQKVVEALSDTLEDTVGRILEIATCEEHTGVDLLDDMDNDQLMEAVEAILEVNFLGVVERGPRIAEKFRRVMETKGPAPAPPQAAKKKK